MVDENGAWTRQSEAFWRAHHEAWKRSDLNQRQYCEAGGIPLKAFGNWRAIFKAEPQPLERKLLYRRRGLSHTLSHSLSHPLTHGNASVIWRANHSAVGCRVTSNHNSCRRPCPTTKKANSRSNVTVGTTHISIAAIASA